MTTTKNFEYRYSLIPGGAVTDPRLEPSDIRILALLGRHTKLGGWCWRSQVKMAKELKVSRSTVQRSLNRLVDSGWVEQRLRGRGDTEPNATKQPFAAHRYRVRLDNEVPEEILLTFDTSDEDEENEGASQAGTSTGGHPGAHPDGHGGAHPSGHPNEGTLSEGKNTESEREDREAELKKPNVGAFTRRWPTASSDDQGRTKRAWDDLSDTEWQAAIDGIEPFLRKAKADGRGHTIAGWRYLEEKRWTLLPEEIVKPEDGPRAINGWSREWWATLFRMIERGDRTELILQQALEGKGWYARTADPVEGSQALQSYPNDGPEFSAWRPWFEARRIKFPEWRTRFWVFLPSPEPPGERSSAA